jgi:hypothetical protein
MQNVKYELLLKDQLQSVAESPPSPIYKSLTERHLQAIWLEQKYFKNLYTLCGKPIEVISPGIWNAEAGPDFLKAHLKIGEDHVFGDVELHLRSESWTQHGHHNDLRYDNVILHVAFWKPHTKIEIATPSGKLIFQTCFEEFLKISPNRIVQLIDLDLYPYKKFVGSGRCAQKLFRTLPELEISRFFKDAASWRLSQKRKYIQTHAENPSLYLGAGIAMALGYKNNAEAFLELFLSLRSLNKTSAEELLAIGMLCCGFFEDSFRRKWGTSEKFESLYKLAKEIPINPPQVKLALNQIRPLNHPVRRLATLSKLLCDPHLPHYFSTMTKYWSESWGNKKPRIMREHLRNLLPTYEDEYWNHHFTFEKEAREDFLPLLGNTLKNEILINTFLPLLQEEVLLRHDAKEMAAFETFFAAIPASDTGKTKYLTHRFFGDTVKGKLLNHADMEQGAYQLHRDFCLHYEASCSGCPFVERYLNLSL